MSDSIANVLAPPSEAVPSLMDVYTRSLQAQKGGIDVQNALAAQKAGRAMQLATDANGIFDPQKAAAIATQMGPEVAPAMADLLNASSDLRTRQLAQANAHTSLTARAAAGIAFNPSDANLDQWHTTLINNGVPPSMADADLAEYKNLSPDGRVALAHQHLSAALDAKDAIERQWPTPSVQSFGGSVGGMAVKPGGPGQPPSATATGPGTTLTASPGEQLQTIDTSLPADKDGIIPMGPDGKPTRTPTTWVPGKVQAAPTMRVPMPGGSGTSGAPAATSTAPAPPPKDPLGPGKYRTDATTVPAAPAPVTPDVPKIVTGPGPQAVPDVAAYNEAIKTTFDQHQNIISGESALEALKQVDATGPGTSGVNTAKSFMIAHGIPGSEGLDQPGTEAYQLARKNMLRFAQSNGSRIGTDLGLSTQLEGNPNVDTLLKGVNRHILVQDVGIARQKLAQTLTMPPGGIGQTDFGNGAAEHVKNFPSGTDWHAFAWDLMDPGERQAYMQSIQPDPKAPPTPALTKFNKSKQIAFANGLWSNQPPGPVAAPPVPGRSPSVPAPPPNPLVLPGP